MKTPQERILTEYWICRRGRIVRYKLKQNDDIEDIVSFHNAIARQHFPNSKNPEKSAEVAGWVKVVNRLFKHPSIERVPTQSQLNTLFGLGWREYVINDKFVKL